MSMCDLSTIYMLFCHGFNYKNKMWMVTIAYLTPLELMLVGIAFVNVVVLLDVVQ
jgi:hypothetical protein